ncbi:unnamed protein product [Laminaria digitata]
MGSANFSVPRRSGTTCGPCQYTRTPTLTVVLPLLLCSWPYTANKPTRLLQRKPINGQQKQTSNEQPKTNSYATGDGVSPFLYPRPYPCPLPYTAEHPSTKKPAAKKRRTTKIMNSAKI